MNEQSIERMEHQTVASNGGALRPSQSGLRYIHSAEYLHYMIGLVAREYELDGSFFGLLVGVTAAFLSDTDPNAEDTDVFDEFVSENISTIRGAIDRIKVIVPEIATAERSWEQTRLDAPSRHS